MTSGAELATAIGTIGAVVVAVGGGAIRWARESRRRPRLSLSHDDPGSQFEMVGPAQGPTWTSYWVRLAVRNRPNKEAARDVEVLLQGIERLAPDLEHRPVTVADFNWTGLDTSTALIGPGVHRTVDLGGFHPVGVGGNAFSFFVLQINPQFRHGRHMLEPGRYRIRVALLASNFNAVRYTVELEFDGDWTGADDVADHLNVNVHAD